MSIRFLLCYYGTLNTRVMGSTVRLQLLWVQAQADAMIKIGMRAHFVIAEELTRMHLTNVESKRER